ncbi:MAG: DUF6454 family protein [Acidobacteriota bacterium]
MARWVWVMALVVRMLSAQQADPQLVVTLLPDLHHVQGIDIEGGLLWVSSVDAKAGKGYLSLLHVRSGKLLRQVEVQEGKRIHAGGLQLDGDSVWLPVAEYDRDGPTTIQRRNKRTLALESSFEVNDHIGCVAAGPGTLMGGNWDSRIVYTWSKDGRELARHPSPSAANFQDLKLDGPLLIGSGNLSREAGAVEWWNPATWKMMRRITTGKTDRGLPFTHEGMTWRQGRLYFLPEDAPSRLFVFAPKK